MLTCRIHAKDDLRIEPAEDPQIGPGEVLIRLGAGGICGSDLHYYFEGRNGSFVIRATGERRGGPGAQRRQGPETTDGGQQTIRPTRAREAQQSSHNTSEPS